MTAYQVCVTPKGHQVYRTVNGIYREYVGPPFETPREAIRYADLIERTTVSPLRPSTEPSTAAGVASPPLVGQVEGSVDVPRGRLPAHRRER